MDIKKIGYIREGKGKSYGALEAEAKGLVSKMQIVKKKLRAAKVKCSVKEAKAFIDFCHWKPVEWHYAGKHGELIG